MNQIENQQICDSAYDCFRDAMNLSIFPKLLRKMILNRVWERRQIRSGKIVELNSLAELITKPPLDGWGEDPKKIEAVIKDDPEVLEMYREAMKPEPGRNQYSSDDNINAAKTPKGTSKAYTLSRLKRESPELFKQVCEGKLSANKAAIKAGFRKKPSNYEAAVTAVSRLSVNEMETFAAWLAEYIRK